MRGEENFPSLNASVLDKLGNFFDAKSRTCRPPAAAGGLLKQRDFAKKLL